MATISHLSDLLSDRLGLDIGTVRHVARNLREEGILPTGPRGGGQNTATIDAPQAAALLVAVLGNSPYRAVEIDAAYRASPLARVDRESFEDGVWRKFFEPAPLAPNPDLDPDDWTTAISANLQMCLAYFIQTRDLQGGISQIMVGGAIKRPYGALQLSVTYPGTRAVHIETLVYAPPGERAPAQAAFAGFAAGSIVCDIADLLDVPPEGGTAYRLFADRAGLRPFIPAVAAGR